MVYFAILSIHVVHVKRLLLHKGDANNVLPTVSHIVVYRDTDIVYRTMWCVSRYTGAPVYCSDPTIYTCCFLHRFILRQLVYI